MSEATDSVKAIVRNVIDGVRTVNELRRCGCDDCREALVVLKKKGDDLAESEKKALENPIVMCQCCGKRPGKRVGPSYSKRYLCEPCIMDPALTFDGCKHGEED